MGKVIIASKDQTSLANMDYVVNIYVAGDWSVKANMNGKKTKRYGGS